MVIHRPDPDAIASADSEAEAYAARVDELGRGTCIEPVLELAYGEDRGQRLDVYAPPDARNLPIVVFFHGGAWINGHRGWLRFMAPAMLRLPAIFVAGTYRLAPRCRWPAQYEDVRDALWCIERHAQALGGDPRRIVVGGHSAGAHLASLVTLKREIPPVLGAFPVSGSHDLQYGPVSWDSPEGRVYKHLFTSPEQDYDASPINFVANNTVQFHVTWGEMDFPRVRDSSARFVRALRSGTAQVTAAILSGASHFDCHLALADGQHPWYAMLKQTLYRLPAYHVPRYGLEL